jgi:hypothetical protein
LCGWKERYVLVFGEGIVRFIELPSYDDKESFIINVETITHISTPKHTGGGASTICFTDGRSIQALVVGKDVDLVRECLGLKPWETK